MTSRQRVMTALLGGIPDRVPFLDLGVDKAVAAAAAGKKLETQWDVADALGMDAMGFPLYPTIYTVNRTADNGRTYIVDGRLKTKADFGMIRLPDTGGSFLDAAKRFVDGAKGHKATWAATNIGLDPLLLGMGLEAFSYALADDPKLVCDILDVYAEWAAKLVQALPQVGFDFVWYTDDIAYKDGPMFSPAVFRELLLPIVRKTAEATALPWIFHSDGNLAPIMDDLLSLGMNGLHPIEPGPMDIVDVKARYGDRVCLVGGVSVDMLTTGTPDEVVAEVSRLVKTVAPGGRYIMSSSNSIASYCRPENVAAMAKAVDELGWY